MEKIKAIPSDPRLIDPRRGCMPEKMALSVAEAAQLISLPQKTVYALVHQKDFPAYQIGNRWRIPTEGLREWVRRQAQEVQP